jgi:D-alanyl-D-alanine endopeptidase (penicillin-binding protein 7)
VSSAADGLQFHPRLGFVLPRDVRPIFPSWLALSPLPALSALPVLPALILLLGMIGLPDAARAQAFPLLTPDGRPNVQAAQAVVMDARTGDRIYGKSADQVAPIASTGKIFVAMVVRERGLDLHALTEITRVDHSYATGGARTRLELRHKFRNIDLLRAMLIASDNRAPTALARAVGLSPEQLVAAMNHKARQLELAHTRFTDPSGLRGNVSTAREMALALGAALADPVLAEILSTREVTIRSVHSRPQNIYYRNTNIALHSDRFQVLGGKTGYTTAAGYCLLIAARIGARQVLMVFLGEEHERTRFGDFDRVAQWMTAPGSRAAPARSPVASGMTPSTAGAGEP